MNADKQTAAKADPADSSAELRRVQNNLLPPDLISNDRHMNDVLWNGPSRSSKIQRAGTFLIGVTLFVCGLAAVSMFYQYGARLLLTPWLVMIAAAGRVIYKSVKPSRPPK
jgi:hypothetical protein